MADAFEGKFDLSSVLAGLNQMATEPFRESLSRSMAVAGGQVLRDDAKALVPVDSGLLKSAIYLAFREAKSTATEVTYSISWNGKKAPHGHLVEFGHWRYNKIVNGFPQKSLKPGLRSGSGPQDHVGAGALAQPVWEPAHPFLRPALTGGTNRARDAMLRRGRDRIWELLADPDAPDEVL